MEKSRKCHGVSFLLESGNPADKHEIKILLTFLTCGDMFYHLNLAFINNVILSFSLGPEQYKCEVCHIPFRSKTKLATHKRKHTEDNPYLCVYCGDTFKYHNELSEHRRSKHLSNKSFKCDHCPMSFETRRQLDAHMWRHTGE